MNTLVINVIGSEKRYAFLKDDKLEKLVIEQPKQQSIIGGIYFGTVEKVLPGMNAAFIDIGLEKNGFLHRDKLPSFLTQKEDKSISAYLHQGEKLLVQVEKDATGDKGPRLTGIIELSSSMIVLSPEGHYVAVSKKIEDPERREQWRRFGFHIKKDNEGILFRTSCEEYAEENVLKELELLREQYETILQAANSMKKPGLLLKKDSFLDEIMEAIMKMDAGKVIVDSLEMKRHLAAHNKNQQLEILYHQEKEGIFSTFRLEQELEKALKRVVWLENGAYLVFDEAEALTIVDVNTGKYSGNQDLQDTVLKTNELAAEEIAHQIRLRDLAGIILIDFIDMRSDKERERVSKIMIAALRNDQQRTRIMGFTPLGILQMTRRRTKVSISETLMSTCTTCDGMGRVASPETVAFQLERELLEQRGRDEEAILIETTEEVKLVFAGEHQIHQKRLEEVIGLKLYFSTKEAAKPYYVLRQIGSVQDIKEKGHH